MKYISLEKLNSLLNVPFEQWHTRGVSLRAVSANSSGLANSGILHDGRYFFRVWKDGNSFFTFEK